MDLNDFTFSEDIEVLHQLDANGNALLLERPESGDEMSEVDGSRELNVNLSSILTSTRSEEELDMKVNEAKKKSAEKVILEATLTNLRSKLVEIEKDNWMFEGPRYSKT